MINASARESGALPLETASELFCVWLAEHRAAFGFQRAAHPIRQLMLLKPFAEFVLCNDLLLSYGASHLALLDSLRWAWDELEAGDYLVRLLLARPDIFRLASVYAPLKRHGVLNRRFETVLRQVSCLRGTASAEMQAWMRLCFHHAAAQIEATAYDPAAAGETWLLSRPEPWCFNDEIAYSVTHEVFYASDFGRCDCKLPAAVRRYLELWVPAWTESYAESGNWDLTAEMIMVGECIGGVAWESSPLALLLAHQRPDGTVPGPAGSGKPLCDGAQSAAEAAFYANYHTTLVSAMATWLCRFRMTGPHRVVRSECQTVARGLLKQPPISGSGSRHRTGRKARLDSKPST